MLDRTSYNKKLSEAFPTSMFVIACGIFSLWSYILVLSFQLSNAFLSNDITCMDCSSLNKLVAAGFSNGNIFVWDMEDRSLIIKWV